MISFLSLKFYRIIIKLDLSDVKFLADSKYVLEIVISCVVSKI